MSGLYGAVPRYTTYSAEKERIIGAGNNRYILYARVRELRRIMPSVKSTAAQPVEFRGAVVPRYLKEEFQRTVRIANERRREMRYLLYPQWDDMTKPEQLIAASNKNILDIPTEPQGLTLDDVYYAAMSEKYLNEKQAADRYIQMWLEYGGDRQVAELIRELAEDYPGAFHTIMEGGYTETEIEFIYPSSKPYSAEQWINRQNRVINFWTTKYREMTADSQKEEGSWKYDWDYKVNDIPYWVQGPRR